MRKTKHQKPVQENLQEIERKRQRVLSEEHVVRCNAQIIPENPGFVRTDGPRRQYEGRVLLDGTIHWVEI